MSPQTKINVSHTMKIVRRAVAAFLILGVVHLYISTKYAYETRRTAVEGIIALHTRLSVCRIAYQETGEIIGSQRQLASTYYYPYYYTPRTPNDRARVSFVVREINGSIVFDGTSRYKEYNLKTEASTGLLTDTNRTRLLLATCGSGEQAVYGNVSYLRSLYQTNDGGIDRTDGESLAGFKSIPPASSWNLPKNPPELTSYIAYMKQLLGLTELKDAWGTPCRIKLVDGVLECRSAGPDRKFGTKDDIVLEKQVGAKKSLK